MHQSRPVSLTILLVFVWISKLLFIGGVLYFMHYISGRKDFYLGIGMRDTTWQFYLLLSGSSIVLLSTFGIFLLGKKAFTFYMVGKIIELVSFIIIIPVFVSGIGTALRGIDESLFLIFSMIALISLWLIFPILFYSYKKRFS